MSINVSPPPSPKIYILQLVFKYNLIPICSLNASKIKILTDTLVCGTN